MSASCDSIEADGNTKVTISVSYTDPSGGSVSGLAVKLSTTEGTLKDTQLTTDNNGNASTSLQADTAGGWADVSASVGQTSGDKIVLMHRVTLEDFSKPQLIAYEPDSNDTSKSSPQISFAIADTPQVGTKFVITEMIYSLSGHDPVAVHTEVLEPDTYTRQWSDFFYEPGQNPGGRALDPGEGLYPFQITVTTTQMDTDALKKKGINSCYAATGSDWKASQSLTIKPKPQNAWALSYDEGEDTTYLTYIFDVYNSVSTTPPQNVRVDVYDPDGNNVGSVTDQLFTPSVSSDGHTFTYTLRGPVTITSAGDYHFVAEVQQAHDNSQGNDTEGKDRDKWALEQNAAYTKPPYVTFGAVNPFTNAAGLPATCNTTGAAQSVGRQLRQMGYGEISPNPSAVYWWTPNISGVQLEASAEDAFGPRNSGPDPVGPLTAQYNAVWVYIGHGSERDDPYKGRKIVFQQNQSPGGDQGNVGTHTFDTTLFSYTGSILDDGSMWFLDKLPPAYQATTRKPSTTSSALINSRLMVFAGCWAAHGTSQRDLPPMAYAMGARCAIGFQGVYEPDDMATMLGVFMRALKAGETIGAAAQKTQYNLDSLMTSYGVMGRDLNGDRFAIKPVGDTSATLADVDANGILGGGDRYLQNARWGWQP